MNDRNRHGLARPARCGASPASGSLRPHRRADLSRSSARLPSRPVRCQARSVPPDTAPRPEWTRSARLDFEESSWRPTQASPVGSAGARCVGGPLTTGVGERPAHTPAARRSVRAVLIERNDSSGGPNVTPWRVMSTCCPHSFTSFVNGDESEIILELA